MTHATLPPGLPVPFDDGACNHLTNHKLPDLSLPSTNNPKETVNLAELTGLTIVFCYPRSGAPNEDIPQEWNAIPGARGCTAQACSIRDNFGQLKGQGVNQVYGLSTQSTEYQQEFVERVHLPYDLLSDSELKFVDEMKLPTFEWQGSRLVKRVTLAIRDGTVIKWWYPVFPADKAVEVVLGWLGSGQ